MYVEVFGSIIYIVRVQFVYSLVGACMFCANVQEGGGKRARAREREKRGTEREREREKESKRESGREGEARGAQLGLTPKWSRASYKKNAGERGRPEEPRVASHQWSRAT